MNAFIKKNIPKPLSGLLKRMLSRRRIAQARKVGICEFVPAYNNQKPRVLFYHAHGLGFGGTEKSLQILAKHLDKNSFDVFFMYSGKKNVSRKVYLENCGVELIEFNYDAQQPDFPFALENMRPHIFDILQEKNINLLITSGAGYPEFPIANVARVPIVYLNMFGSVNTQPNIVRHLCISDMLRGIVRSALPKARVETFPIQSEGPDDGAEERGKELRVKLGIPEGDIVFGRIGRPDDGIYDPIGIKAFRIAAQKQKNIHYVIVAPPPALQKELEGIPQERVHLLPPTGDEKEIWAFHCAIDVLAHFRKDGETMGLNIAESMLCGNPVITHISRYWNAHLEFLDDSFSRVARVDDYAQYAGFMQELALRGRQELAVMGQAARVKAENRFLISRTIARVETILTASLKRQL